MTVNPPPSSVLRFVTAWVVALCLWPLVGQGAGQITDYVVGPQDVLTIQVFDQADLGGKYPVEADGTVAFPLIGRIKVGGLVLRDIETLLRQKLSDGFFKNPQISVAVEQYRSQKVFVVGEVRSPGTYTMSGEMSLIEALARAGSTLPSASGQAVIVRPKALLDKSTPKLPGPDSSSEVTNVDLKSLEDGDLTKNVVLRDGDTVFVPKAEFAYVFGQVRAPGAYPLQKDTTVLQALALAGGVTDRGSTGRIQIVRLVNGSKTEIKAKLGDLVQPGDTIIVPERFF